MGPLASWLYVVAVLGLGAFVIYHLAVKAAAWDSSEGADDDNS